MLTARQRRGGGGPPPPLPGLPVATDELRDTPDSLSGDRMDTIFMLNLAGIVAFGVAVLGFFYMMGKKKREEDRDRKD